MADRLLEVKGLKVSFATEDGVVHAVDGVDFELDRGQVLGIVGESGSGKSVTAMTLLGLTRDRNTTFEGEVLYKGQDILSLPESGLRDVRGNEIAMIFQDPMTSLNPVYKVGDQIVEAILTHESVSKRDARKRAIELLRQVGIPQPEQRVYDYPHQFSGGMRQRAMIAMALSCNPDILVADEPTTALDVTIQAQILELIDRLKDDFDSAVILITHDLGVVAEVANDILVMYAGRVVERGGKRDIFYDPQMPYTWGLLGSIPRLDRPEAREALLDRGHAALADQPSPRLQVPPTLPARVQQVRDGARAQERRAGVEAPRPLLAQPGREAAPAREDHHRRDEGGVSENGQPLVEIKNLKKYFPIKKGVLAREVARVHAVDDVSLAVSEGETLGLVGESGCGKSTLGRCVVRLHEPTAGEVIFDGHSIAKLNNRALRPLRREMQMIFQDPYASLNPRKRVGTIIGDPLRIHGMGDRRERKEKVEELLRTVGLSPEHYNRFPHEFSGGQRQRIGVARALALRPKLIVADEPVSALDVSIQAQMVNLLGELQDDFRLTYIFIAHDLGVVRHVSDRIAVMYLGKLVELSPAEELYTRPIMPYTEALLSAVPVPDPDLSEQRERIVLEGDVPSPINPPSGCRFHPRCRYATEICSQVEPPLVDYGNSHFAACHHPLNVDKETMAGLQASEEAPAQTD